MNKGDIAKIVGTREELCKYCLSSVMNELVTLDKPITGDQADSYPKYRGGWIVYEYLTNNGPWWIPAQHLQLVTQKTTEQKEQNSMIISIRVVKKPTVLAQQAGAVEEIVVPETEIVSNDIPSAALILGAQNADVISKLKSSEIKVVANTVANS